MLTNPYPTKIDSADESGTKLQCDIHPGDKALLMSLRPSKGTIQLIVNNLLKHLCDDIRELNITGWTVDGDRILDILVERRPLSKRAVELLRNTSICTTGAVPPRVLEHRRGSGVRKETPESKAKPTDAAKRTPRRVERTGEESSQQKSTES